MLRERPAPTASRATTGRASLQRARRDVTALVFIGPAIAYLLLLGIFPLGYALWLSTQNFLVMQNAYEFVGLANYAEILRDPDLRISLVNSIVFTLAATGIELVLGVALALFFHRDLPARGMVRALLILPMMITPIVVGLMWRALLNVDWGLVNFLLRRLGLRGLNWTGDPGTALLSVILVDVWQWTPFMFLIALAGLQSLPTEVFEAGRVDGAGRLATLRYLTLPLLRPALTVAVLFRGIDAFRAFDIVFGVTYGGPGRASSTLSFYTFQTAFTNSRYGYAAAISIGMVLLIVVATTLFLRAVRAQARG